MSNTTAGPVVVLTGALSGVGRVTAHAFAHDGAQLVLAARDPEGLTAVAEECCALGAACITYPVDVTDAAAVDRLRDAGVDHFGRIDVWVNCAAMLLLGNFEDLPLADFCKVIETNLFGYVHGARAALSQFRAQGRGTLINVDSVLGLVSEPYASAYASGI